MTAIPPALPKLPVAQMSSEAASAKADKPQAKARSIDAATGIGGILGGVVGFALAKAGGAAAGGLAAGYIFGGITYALTLGNGPAAVVVGFSVLTAGLVASFAALTGAGVWLGARAAQAVTA